jgi:hypothetical protein
MVSALRAFERSAAGSSPNLTRASRPECLSEEKLNRMNHL